MFRVNNFCNDTMRFCVENLLGREYEPIDGSAKRFGGLGAFRYFRRQRACWSLIDRQAPSVVRDGGASQRQLALDLFRDLPRGAAIPLFVMIPTKSEGLVVRFNVETTLVLARQLGRVWKVLRLDNSRNEVIENEVIAHQYLPHLVPKVFEFQPPGPAAPGYVLTGYVPNDQPVTFSDWPQILRKLQPHLLDLYDAASVLEMDSHSYVADLERRVRDLDLRDKDRLDRQVGILCEYWMSVVYQAQQQVGPVPVFNALVHGDIEPCHVRRSGDSLRLIDWGNMSRRNIFYDLFMQGLHLEEPWLWRKLPTAAQEEIDTAFFGWAELFLDGVQSLLSYRFSIQEINFHLACCYLDKFISDMERYRGQAGQGEMEYIVRLRRSQMAQVA